MAKYTFPYSFTNEKGEPLRVALQIDMDALAKTLATKARLNRKKRVTLAAGSVVLKVEG